jgi:hypothetical protein
MLTINLNSAGVSLNLIEAGRAAAAADASCTSTPFNCSAAAASLSKAITRCLALMLLQIAAQFNAHFCRWQQQQQQEVKRHSSNLHLCTGYFMGEHFANAARERSQVSYQ